MLGVAAIQLLLYAVTENAGSSSWPKNRKKCDNGVRYLHSRMRLGMLSGKLVNGLSSVCTVGSQTIRCLNCDMLATGKLQQRTHPCCDQSDFHRQNEQRSSITSECILQVMIWKSLNVVHMGPCEWFVEDGLLSPVMTDMAPAPNDLLKYVRCKCKTSSTNPYNTNLCSCQKSRLKCVTACRD